jgi:HK97 family phage major capsid protein
MDAVILERNRLYAEANTILLEAERLLKTQDGKEARSKADVLVARASLIKQRAASLVSDEERLAKLNDLRASEGLPAVERLGSDKSAAQRASEEVRSAILGEQRTYTALNISVGSQGGFFVPAQFEERLIELQMSAGPLYAGSPALSNIETTSNGPRKMPLTDDTAATGYVQTENGAPTEAEVTLSQVSMGTSTFSSGIVVMSNELIQDISGWATGEGVLQSSLAKRLGRIQNSTFLASLITTLTANSSASVAAAGSVLAYRDLVALVGGVNAAYRYSDKAGFLMNSSTQKLIAGLADSQGRPLFPDVMASRPKLMGYPVYISDFADSVASGKNPILFGDWSYVFLRHIPGIALQTMKERFSENFQTGFIARKRADMQYSVPSTSDSAIKMLHFA